jgi:hypothetical protein
VLVKADGVIWAKETSTYGDWIGPVEFKGDTGEKGDTGDQGPIGRGPTPKGAYNPEAAYVLDDAVLDNGSTWIALGPTTGNAPPVLPATSNAHWQLLARKGTDGSGTGDVVGPPSSGADRIAVYSGTTGKLLKDGGKTLAEVTPGNNSVNNAILADMASNTFKGRITAGTGDPEDLTSAQALVMLKVAGAYARDNILGTVGQTSGVPTGAVIETGNNANGSYVRFANGTQICFTSKTIFLDTNLYQGVTLPSAFVDVPRTAMTFASAASSGFDANWQAGAKEVVAYGGVNSVLYLLASGSFSASGIVYGVHFGRWF